MSNMYNRMWENGHIITAEKLNRMWELAEAAYDESLNRQITEMKLLCDERGKIWGTEMTSAAGGTVTIPTVLLTVQPYTFPPLTIQTAGE